MGINDYFYDTYALIEIIFANPNYDEFKISTGAITTKFNLFELHYILLKYFDEKTADEYYDKLLQYSVEIEDNEIKLASKFRTLHKKNK